MTDQTPELLPRREEVARAIYFSQRGRLIDQGSVTAQRPWRDENIPDTFWNHFLADADAVLALTRPTPAERSIPQENNMSITFGDRLIDSGHYDITPEQEREIEAREECARRGLDPDDDAADDVTVWMVVDKEMRERRPVPQVREALVEDFAKALYDYEPEDQLRWDCLPEGQANSFREMARFAIRHVLLPTARPSDAPKPDFETAARALGFQQMPSGKWWAPNPLWHVTYMEHWDSAEAVFSWLWENCTARPFDAAVAWRELECVLNDLMLTVHDCRNLPTFKLRKELRKILEPLYALPPDEPARVTPPTVEEKRKLPDEEAASKTATRLLNQWSEIAGAESFAPYQETMAFLGKPNSVGWIWAHEVRFERNFDVEQERTRNLAIQAIADAEERASPTIASEKECGKAEIELLRNQLAKAQAALRDIEKDGPIWRAQRIAREALAPPAASLIAKETP